jgi:pheromone shutdown protein TraB
MSITPNGSSQGADDQMVAANVLLAADVAADAAVGKRVSWVDIHTPIIAVGGWLGTLIEAIAPQLHPLDAGHSLIAATLWPYLAAAIAGV